MFCKKAWLVNSFEFRHSSLSEFFDAPGKTLLSSGEGNGVPGSLPKFFTRGKVMNSNPFFFLYFGISLTPFFSYKPFSTDMSLFRKKTAYNVIKIQYFFMIKY